MNKFPKSFNPAQIIKNYDYDEMINAQCQTIRMELFNKFNNNKTYYACLDNPLQYSRASLIVVGRELRKAGFTLKYDDDENKWMVFIKNAHRIKSKKKQTKINFSRKLLMDCSHQKHVVDENSIAPNNNYVVTFGDYEPIMTVTLPTSPTNSEDSTSWSDIVNDKHTSWAEVLIESKMDFSEKLEFEDGV